ncbi:MAG: hypothetical protein ACJ785_05810 [Gemmatimonadaceae bacterium]
MEGTTGTTEVGAALQLVEGLDEEGGIIGRTLLSDTAVVAFFRDHLVFVDADVVLHYLAPKVRVGVGGGALTLDGTTTGIPVESRDSLRFVPLRLIAERYRAYTRIDETPGRMVTLWRHDVLCRYARNADRRAAVFLEAAEQGLLRQCNPPIDAQVRRWANAVPSERWAASLTFKQTLDSVNVTALLAQYRAAPYAAYAVVAGHHLIVRVPPDSASLEVLARLRAAAIDALERGLCGLSTAVDRRSHGNVIRSRGQGIDAFHGERYMLASALATERELPRVRAGASIVFGVDVIANVSELRRLLADPRVQRFEPATKLDSTWVLPGPDLNAVEGVRVTDDIVALDSVALFARLDAEAALTAKQCISRDDRR